MSTNQSESNLSDNRLALACKIVGDLLATGIIVYRLDDGTREATVDYAIRLIYGELLAVVSDRAVDCPNPSEAVDVAQSNITAGVRPGPEVVKK